MVAAQPERWVCTLSETKYPAPPHDFLWSSPARKDRAAAYRLRSAAVEEERRYCLSPLCIARAEYAAWKVDMPALLGLARRAVMELPALGPQDQLSRLAEAWRGRERMPPAMRADGMLTAEGLRLCELNMTPGNGGVWPAAFMSHWFGVRPDPRDGLRSLVRELVERNGGKLVLGLLEAQGRGEKGWLETRDTMAWLREMPGVRVFRVEPGELEAKRGRMRDGRRAYDALFPTYPFEGRRGADAMMRLLSVMLRTSTVFTGDPIDLRMDDKALMAMLSEAADDGGGMVLSAKERALVKRYIPWTRLVRAGGSVRRLVARRKSLVLKRTRSFNSMHVIAGSQCTEARWRELLERAMRGRIAWVVQERMVPKPQRIVTVQGEEWRDCMVCPFVFGEEWAGALVRIAEPQPRPFAIAYRAGMNFTVAESL